MPELVHAGSLDARVLLVREIPGTLDDTSTLHTILANTSERNCLQRETETLRSRMSVDLRDSVKTETKHGFKNKNEQIRQYPLVGE